MADDSNKRKLKYEAELNPLMDFIQTEYRESSLCVFRSVLSVFLHNMPFDPSMTVNGLKMKMALRKIQQNYI